jgi:DNA invertase Pin-like site-specific DNA recombinase
MYAPQLTGKRIAIYARYSSSSQRDASIDDQVRTCTVFIERGGGQVQNDLIFTDRAVSGSSLDRAGLERLMSLVMTRPPSIDTIICEDLSRITRDLADGAALFKRLQFAGVSLVGVADNIDTTEPSAKMHYGLKALMSEAYIDDLRFRTKRGLDGRALKDFSTGGLPIGYRSEPVLGDGGAIVGHRIVIDEAGKATVTRIFKMCCEGMSLDSIAHTLNAEQVPPPRARTKHRRKGWVASTIRGILRNRAYIGEFTFNRRQWLKVPDTNVRRYRLRPEAEVIRRSRPHLRIVDAELWDDVHARLKTVRDIYVKTESPGSPRPATLGKRTSYPLSGLLYCAECGAPLTIYGGTSAHYYRCSDFKKRGTCKNGLSLREDVARTRLFGLLHQNFTGAKEVSFLRKSVAELLGGISRKAKVEIDERRQRLARTEQRIGGLIHFIADGDHSDYVRTTLKDLEAQANTEKRAIAELQARGSDAIRLPSLEETAQRGLMFERMLAENPVAGREEMRKLFENGKVLCRPQPEGFYIAEGTLFPLALFSMRLTVQTPKPGDSGESPGLQGMSRGQEPSCSIVGCAGLQLDFPVEQLQGVGDVWMPFEESIAIGWG